MSFCIRKKYFAYINNNKLHVFDVFEVPYRLPCFATIAIEQICQTYLQIGQEPYLIQNLFFKNVFIRKRTSKKVNS